MVVDQILSELNKALVPFSSVNVNCNAERQCGWHEKTIYYHNIHKVYWKWYRTASGDTDNEQQYWSIV